MLHIEFTNYYKSGLNKNDIPDLKIIRFHTMLFHQALGGSIPHMSRYPFMWGGPDMQDVLSTPVCTGYDMNINYIKLY